MKIAVHVIGQPDPVVRDATPEEEAAILAGHVELPPAAKTLEELVAEAVDQALAGG